jgi:hypothetical protein
MNRKLNLGLSLAAGLLGGLLSHWVSPELVHAQAKVPPAKEVRAQSFVLVDDQDVAVGVFGFDKDENASIKLMDKMGKVAWSASSKPSLAPLSSNIVR